MKKFSITITFIYLFIILSFNSTPVLAQDKPYPDIIFDDKLLLDGYYKKYSTETQDTLLAMIKDDALTPYRMAAAIRVFKDTFADKVVSREKAIFEKFLLRRMARSDSAFVQVEIMHTLCRIDRFKYVAAMLPALVLKLDHYNKTVNTIAFTAIEDVKDKSINKVREARYIFNTLRKVLFLSRKKLKNIQTPDFRLAQKLQLLRWSIKVLGKDELNRLPKEVLHLL